MSRRHNVRRIKAHWTYTAVELADTLHVNITTVRHWKREGLLPIPATWPHLFAASEIVAFLNRKNKPRHPLSPGEIYCVACKKVRRPAGDVVRITPRSETHGAMVGRCPTCGREIFRCVRLAEIEEKSGFLKVRYENGQAPICSDRDPPRSEGMRRVGL